jgi:hypothetical protein
LHGKTIRNFGVNELGGIHQEVGTLFGITVGGCDAQVVHVKTGYRTGHGVGQLIHYWFQDRPQLIGGCGTARGDTPGGVQCPGYCPAI